MKKVLITDAYSQQALHFIRSITGEDYQVFVAGASRNSLSFYSKYAKHRLVYTSYLENVEKFVESLRQISTKNDIDYIIPISESSIEILAKAKKEFHPTKVVTPPKDSIELSSDKSLLLRMAIDLGLRCPKTLPLDLEQFPESWEKRKLKNELEGHGINFPVVLKWSRSRRIIRNKVIINKHTQYFTSLDQLSEFLKNFSCEDKNILIQEFVSGRGYGCSGLSQNGEVKVLFCHKRLREKTLTGGPSALAESILPFEEITEPTKKIIRKLDWFGPFMVEFKGENDKMFIMEMNGRLWGSYPLAVKAGLNIPLMYLKLVQGKVIDQYNYRTGIKGGYFWGDLKNLYSTVFNIGSKDWPGKRPSPLKSILT